MISLLYITKNEEDNIKRSINSCKDGVDEIIVVDTGSTDNTVQVCKDLGATVYHYKWKNDFADARNYALSKANEDWVMFLDADEYFAKPIDKTFQDTVAKIIKDENINFIKLLVQDFDIDKGIFINNIYGMKLYKNDARIRYTRRIHEQLAFKGIKDVGVLLATNPIIHTGYRSSQPTVKPKRNLEILQSIKKPNTLDLFYLIRETLSLGMYEESEKYCDMFFKRKNHLQCVQEYDIVYLAFFYKLEIMKELSNKYTFEDMIKYLDSIKEVMANNPRLYYEYAKLYMTHDYKKANDAINHAFQTHEKVKDMLEFDDFNSYYPTLYYLEAKIQYVTGRLVEAEKTCIKACMIEPHNRDFIALLLKIVSYQKPNYIIKLLKRIYNPKLTSDYAFLVSMLVNTPLPEVFSYFAIELNTKHNGGNSEIFMAMLVSNQIDVCINTCDNLYAQTNNAYYEFIKTVALIYADSEDYYNRYYTSLSAKYQQTLDLWFNLNIDKVSDRDEDLFMDCCIRLFYLIDPIVVIRHIPENMFDDIEILHRICLCLEQLNRYDIISDLYSQFLFTETAMQKEWWLNKPVLDQFVLSLFFTKQYQSIENIFECFGLNKDHYVYNLLLEVRDKNETK